MSVHEKLRAYIDSQGLEQAGVAKKANMPAAALKTILSGKHKMQVDDLRALCYALNTAPEAFVDFKPT